MKPDLYASLAKARTITDGILRLVRPDSIYERPIAERHRAIFYLGHLEAFEWNLLWREALDRPAFNPEFDRLFAFGIDPDSTQLPRDTPSDWPKVEEVRAYNARVREALDASLGEMPEQMLHVAIEHRLMHAETFAYMLHNLPREHKVPGPPPEVAEARGVPEEMARIPTGAATLGVRAGEGFGWDNEFERCEVEVAAFSLGKHKVTNGQYLEFVEQGGSPPYFWGGEPGRWFWRGMFADVPLPLDWPVYCTQEQASTYAAWKGMRLPTEAEFQRAAYAGTPPDPDRDNFDFRRWDPAPAHGAIGNAFGLVQMVGNGWEWTSSPFEPFPGFRPFPFYQGYSEPFFDGQHYVLKGASPVTAAMLTRPSFRNWFRPSYPYVWAGFRLAAD
jgi:gamma-glutamyl hercynylcysteine S-oxide synthase